MAKRENRIAPMQHEVRQITNLKTLEPIATLPEAREYSEHLLDISIAALEEAIVLESGQPIRLARLEHLMDLINQIAAIAHAAS